MTEARFARELGVSERTVAHWAAHPETVPRQAVQDLLDQMLAAAPEEAKARFAAEADGIMPPPTDLLGQVPQSFHAKVLSGPWVTAYQFMHAGKVQHHADIAHIEADSDGQIRAANHPPEPRTEGRSSPFRNLIEAKLYSRHLIGTWKNTSDARYFGVIHLAVQPGEMVMDGYYTGFASDIEVSTGRWRWVRLDVESAFAVTLLEPAVVYDAVMRHPQDDAPLTIDDVAEGT